MSGDARERKDQEVNIMSTNTKCAARRRPTLGNNTYPHCSVTTFSQQGKSVKGPRVRFSGGFLVGFQVRLLRPASVSEVRVRIVSAERGRGGMMTFGIYDRRRQGKMLWCSSLGASKRGLRVGRTTESVLLRPGKYWIAGEWDGPVEFSALEEVVEWWYRATNQLQEYDVLPAAMPANMRSSWHPLPKIELAGPDGRVPYDPCHDLPFGVEGKRRRR